MQALQAQGSIGSGKQVKKFEVAESHSWRIVIKCVFLVCSNCRERIGVDTDEMNEVMGNCPAVEGERRDRRDEDFRGRHCNNSQHNT